MVTLTDEQLAYFVQEIEVQCEFAYDGYSRIYQAMERYVDAPHNQGPIHIGSTFAAIHSMLTHLGNVSKLLWPVAPRRERGESAEDFAHRCAGREDRGAQLRATLAVPEDSLLRDRTLRDHFEHYDERLEEFLLAMPGKPLIDMALNLRQWAGQRGAEIHRLFDFSDFTLVYQHDQFDLMLAAQAIRDLRDATRRWLFNHGVWDREDSDAWYNTVNESVPSDDE